MQPILKLEDICKIKGTELVLNHAELELFPGEVLGIIGENGAGKSTLVSCISGAEQPDNGKILLSGKQTDFHSPADSIRQGIATLYQDVNLIPEFTVAENIHLGNWPKNRLKQIDRKKINAEAQCLLNLLDETIDCKAKVKSLCYSQKRTVELAKAISQKAKILILDEPCINYSGMERDMFARVLQTIKVHGVGIILISHQISSVLELCNNVVFMANGKVSARIDSQSINSDNIVHYISGSEDKHIYPKIPVKSGRPLFQIKHVHSTGLDGLDLEIGKHEIVGVLASTLPDYYAIGNLIKGKDQITAGSVELNGQKVDFEKPGSAIRTGIGYISDEPLDSLFYNLDISSNITVTNLKNVSNQGNLFPRAEKKLAQDLIKAFSIKVPRGSSQLTSLSLGTQQKVRLAQCLFASCRVYILENPTTGIDVCTRIDVYNYITNMAISGAGFLLISTDIEELIGMCDRIVILKNGKVSSTVQRKNFSRDYFSKILTEQ